MLETSFFMKQQFDILGGLITAAVYFKSAHGSIKEFRFCIRIWISYRALSSQRRIQ